ncbi:MAG: F0F1 ATP synthase subunit delta [Actinobacteria bacterium]|nr:F0F1 ATP synthase subunit delta [Actinomycetota bacterium]
MFGSSRESLATLRTALQARHSDASLASVAGELLAVAGTLSREKALRVALADAGTTVATRSGVANSVFSGKVGATTLAIVDEVIAARWSNDADLVAALEVLGAQAACIAAQSQNALDRVEEEVFLFGRAVAGSSELQMALTNPSLSAAAKSGIVESLLAGKAHDITGMLLTARIADLRGARVDSAVEELLEVAADQRKRLVAEVTSAVSLTTEQHARLANALKSLTGRDININVIIDREVLGGIRVRIGDDLIDGTIASRLESASRAVKAD